MLDYSNWGFFNVRHLVHGYSIARNFPLVPITNLCFLLAIRGISSYISFLYNSENYFSIAEYGKNISLSFLFIYSFKYLLTINIRSLLFCLLYANYFFVEETLQMTQSLPNKCVIKNRRTISKSWQIESNE